MNRLIRIFLIAALLSTQSMSGWAAIGATTIWHVRVGGNNANGGGYDSAVSGATTDYTDQDAAQLTVTDIVTTGGTTVTSVTGGFTSAMIGNCLRIVGDNYYFITARASSNSITVDRNTGTASGQTGSVGGAFATFGNFWSGGSIAQPSIATPLKPGNIVYVRGSGSNDPTSDDYTYPAGDYSSLPNGDTTNGKISFIGYNGRPRINYSGLMAYQSTYIQIENLFLYLNASAGYPQYGFGAITASTAINCKVDVNGLNNAIGLFVVTAIGNHIVNSGTTSIGSTGAGIQGTSYGGAFIGNLIEDVRYDGIAINNSICNVVGNIILRPAHMGIVGGASSGTYGSTVVGNTVVNSGSDGFYSPTPDTVSLTVMNNIFYGSGGYCMNFASSVDRFKAFVDYNDLYNCSSGLRNNISAGAHDLNLDPQFTNAAGGDYSIGTNLANMGFPSLIGGATTYSYVDMGAAQRQATGGGAAATVGFTFAQ